MVVEDSEGNGSLSNSACADESDGSEVFREANDRFDPLVTSKEDPRGWWW
jgi:hypothetical protein